MSAVCSLPGCPKIVPSDPRRVESTRFCSEQHLSLYLLIEIRHAMRALGGHTAFDKGWENLTLDNVAR